MDKTVIESAQNGKQTKNKNLKIFGMVKTVKESIKKDSNGILYFENSRIIRVARLMLKN